MHHAHCCSFLIPSFQAICPEWCLGVQSNKDLTLSEVVRMLTDVQSLANLPHRIAAQEQAQVRREILHALSGPMLSAQRQGQTCLTPEQGLSRRQPAHSLNCWQLHM